MKIYLIEYKCSDKTTIGSSLAEKPEMDFIDLDTYIEAKHNKSIPNLLKLKGQSGLTMWWHINKMVRKKNGIKNIIMN